MLFPRIVGACALAALASTAAASDIQVRNIPGKSTSETISEVWRHLLLAREESPTNTVYQNSTSLDTSLVGQTLFKFDPEKDVGSKPASAVSKDAAPTQSAAASKRGASTTVKGGIAIICSTCYIKGDATAKLDVDKSFNLTSRIDEINEEFSDTLHNLTHYGKEILQEIKNGTDLDDFHLPPPDFDLDLRIPNITAARLELVFKDTDIYVALDTVLSSQLTYTLTLYSSHELGVQLTQDLFFGVVFTVDLILSVDGEIDISSGFHIRFDKDVVLQVGLFEDEASHMSFEGGRFEFLPVQVESAGVVFTAVLRLQIRAGFSLPSLDLSVPVEIGDLDLHNLKVGAGIEARLYANVAQFTTNVTAGLGARDADDADDKGCDLRIAQGYQFAIGAAAGASLQVFDHVWGPTAEIEVPIFYTEMAHACAMGRSAPTTTAPAIEARATGGTGDSDLETTTVSTKVTYQAVVCKSTGLIDCPASLQTPTRRVTETTVVTSLPSGSDFTWATNAPAKVTAKDFGANAMTMTPSSGKPSSYVPPPSSSTATNGPQSSSKADGILNEKTGGVSNKVIIGVSVGLGVPVLLGVIAGIVFCIRRPRYKQAATT